MDKKGMIRKMPLDVLEKVEEARHTKIGNRVGITALGRSTEWRKDLDEMSILEVVDRNVTTAILIKPDTYKALLDYIEQTEKELEQAQVEALYGDRLHDTEFYSGEELAEKAMESFNERRDQLRGLLDEFTE